MSTSALLHIDELRVDFAARKGGRRTSVRAIDGVSLRVDRGETLGLVGESGSGKSTIGNAVLGLVRPTSGKILFDGRDITSLAPRARRQLSSRLQVVFQDPYASLNPYRTVGQTLVEPLVVRDGVTRSAAAATVADVLVRVGLEPSAADRYPSQFSGGQRQRVAIARALVRKPELIVCDEPTSALDLSVQAQILNLLITVQRDLGVGYLFISHDIDVVRYVADRVAVLFRGRLVEEGLVESVIDAPRDEYTRRLIAAAPVLDPDLQRKRNSDASRLGVG
jgi:ABC-type glutathione transport system ATPase component